MVQIPMELIIHTSAELIIHTSARCICVKEVELATTWEILFLSSNDRSYSSFGLIISLYMFLMADFNVYMLVS